MEQGLQKLNADQRLAVWTQRIADCRSSGKGVKHWYQENDISEKTFYWQRRIFKLARQLPLAQGRLKCRTAKNTLEGGRPWVWITAQKNVDITSIIEDQAAVQEKETVPVAVHERKRLL